MAAPTMWFGRVMAIRSAANIKGYWKNPDATVAAFTADGYLKTGDIGFLDGDGEGHLDLPRMVKGGMAGGFFAIFTPNPNDPDHDDLDMNPPPPHEDRPDRPSR